MLIPPCSVEPAHNNETGLMRPRGLALALEPRILFDGAAAVAAADPHPPQGDAAADDAAAAWRPVTGPEPTAAAGAPRHLVVLDGRLRDIETLAAAAAAVPGAELLRLQSGEDGLAAISAALSRLGQVDSIQIFSHGAAGQFSLGSQRLTADRLSELSGVLGGWRQALSPQADIQLYGCDVAADKSGVRIVEGLRALTGADVGASSNASGQPAAGGDWVLEVTRGRLDQPLALAAAGLSAYRGLLADASPSTSLPSGGDSVLLGEQFRFTVSLSNPSAQVGFAPYVDLFLPSTGRDGDDGVSFISASYLGQSVLSQVIRFDAAGNATHPLARDASGQALVLRAADYGLRAGDSLVVLQLPFASVSQGQPMIDVQVTATLSSLADTRFSHGEANLVIKARGGFQFGNDSLDNPTSDPSLVEASTHDFVVRPTVVKVSVSLDTPEGETSTGPNYGRTLIITGSPAPNQQISNVLITQALPGQIQVTAITPADGGTLESITLADGSVISNPALIATLIAADDVFISAFSVRYATVSAPVATRVSFYVPETDSTGQPVLDPSTGNPSTITLPGAAGGGDWVPLDARDLTPPQTSIVFDGTAESLSFRAQSISLLKQVHLRTDVGQTGLTPGDTLEYLLELTLSDYFGFGQTQFGDGRLIVVDQVADGQQLSSTPTLTVYSGGSSRSVAVVSSSTVNGDGSTTLTLDLAASLRAQGGVMSQGALAGDLALDSMLAGATKAVISYSTELKQSYTAPAGAPHSELNEGDSVGNSALLTASVLRDRFTLTGHEQTDGSSTRSTLDQRQVGIAIFQVNGAQPPASGELRPGDVVTFRLRYELLTGDYEQLKLSAYLPLPLMDLAGISWDQGAGVGQWSLGLGNTNADAVNSVSTGSGNSVVFDLGSHVNSGVEGSRVELLFTVRIGDAPFADQRALNVLAQSSQLKTLSKQEMVSSGVVQIVSIAEPVLSIMHGVVAASHGTISGGSGSWKAPGSSGVPFNGSITELSAVDGNISGIDGGDTLRLATAIENSGGGGAFDVGLTVTVPNGLRLLGDSLATANLQIHRGDGTALAAGVDYSVSGNEISFLDPGNVASLLPGRSGTAADASGANLVIISYEVHVYDGANAGRSHQSSAALTRYASVNNGSDFAPVDLSDIASEQLAAPEVRKYFAGGGVDNTDSSATHTSGADLVVGESMLYDVMITLPEGQALSLSLSDLVPPGLRIDTSFGGGFGYQLITRVADSAVLGADFVGTVVPSTLGGQGGVLGEDGVDGQILFSAAIADADNVTGNNSFVIRMRLVASNVLGNQSAHSLQNSAGLHYSDPDGDTPGSASPLDRSVSLIGGQPTVTVREPTLRLSQSVNNMPGLGVDAGSPISYAITLSNGTASSDFDAFDIQLSDLLPSQLSGLSLANVSYSGGASNNGGPDFQIVGNELSSLPAANIDIPRGGTVVLTISGTVNDSAASLPEFSNSVTVQWTSLDSSQGASQSQPGERTGADGLPASGVLNDYRASSQITVPVAQGVFISRVGGLPDTAAASPTNGPPETVTVGELIRYRVVSLMSEGTQDNYQLQVTLDKGLGFINDGTVRVAFISNGGLRSDVGDLTSGGALAITGDETSAEAKPISPDLSGAAPTAVLNPSQIQTSTDANGNTVLVFSFGRMSNIDADANLEELSLEFSARVLNVASNVAGAALSASVLDRSGSTQLSQPHSVRELVAEPRFTGLNKQVVSFTPVLPAGSGSGEAQLAIAFQHNGGAPAFEVSLVDAISGGSDYRVDSVSINGVSYGAGQWAAQGITVDSNGGIQVGFVRLEVQDKVELRYRVSLPNEQVSASSNATLTWSSLPESFSSWGGSTVGIDATADGERDGSGSGPNTYVLSEGAGLGLIRGSLWNDTASATGSTTPDGPGLPGRLVTLTWAGLDGDLATTADNLQYSTTTDAGGAFHFGVLPAGVFRIEAPSGALSNPQPIGELRLRIDSDAASPLGQVQLTLGEAGQTRADFGYVAQNDAPVNTVPGTQSGTEDVALPIAGISIFDVDAGSAGHVSVGLSVAHGKLWLSATPPGVSVVGSGTASMSLVGSVADLNLALAALVYQGQDNFNGSDTLRVLTNDHGSFGDGDGDGTPGEDPEDGRTDQDLVSLVIAAVNDAPSAAADAATAVEAGGVANAAAGVDPRGSLLANDSDVDSATNADQLRVVSAGLLGGAQHSVPGSGALTLVGLYGSLTVGSGGGYQYVVDNANLAVQALRLSGQTLSEQFSYQIQDLAGAASGAVLTVTLQGANDAPVAGDDGGMALEAGGVLNGSPGSPGTGQVLPNDSDVDSAANGEALRVSGIRNVGESEPGAAQTVAAGSTAASGGSVISGRYGTLTIGADGSYGYVIDDNSPEVQALVPGTSLVDVFSYQLSDAAGLLDLAELRITVNGAYDNPLASDDLAAAQAGSGGVAVGEVNPIGNVILFPSRPGSPEQPGGNGIDQDVDAPDQPSSLLVVDGVRPGLETAADAFTAVAAGTDKLTGTQIAGSYGMLRIGADGSYFYDVDSGNPAVMALLAGQTLNEVFSYQLTDTSGRSDSAQLLIVVHGVNDPPVAQTQVSLAVEAGGVANGTPGLNPAGNVLLSDSDPDGDSLSVVALRTGSEFSTDGTAGTIGQPLVGRFGSLTLNADGSYTYQLDNSNEQLQSLRRPAHLLLDRFTYTVSDGKGESDQAEVIIVISGRNDTPVAADDAAQATESGGVNNGRPGSDPSGNVLDNDGDADGGEKPSDPFKYRETQAVASVRSGSEAGSGSAGTLGSELRGSYGWLTLHADGSYNYRVDNELAAVQGLRGTNDSLQDQFSYQVVDAAGALDSATLSITIRGANDAPRTVADTVTVIEAGGVDNGTPGSAGSGNVLANDSDVDAYGEQLSVVGVGQDGQTGLPGEAFSTQYGRLTLNADGSYSYLLDNANAAVQALRTAADVLVDSVRYTVRDLAGETSEGLLSIVIRGRNDNPVARDDLALAREAGGTLNGTPGADPSGQLLAKDSDVDANDSMAVDGLRLGSEAAGGGFSLVGSGGLTLSGQYGRLTVATDGSYHYQVDNNLVAVQALHAGQLVQEHFSYRMRDAAGASDVAELRIVVQGAWDAPVANNDRAFTAVDDGQGNPVSRFGNVLHNDREVDAGDPLRVSGIALGREGGGGTLLDVNPGTDSSNGQLMMGLYGELIIGSDGSARYTVDPQNPAVLALAEGQLLHEYFSYGLTDGGGLSDQAEIHIIIRGRNDAPTAGDDAAGATEAGGSLNGTPGVDPGGNVFVNDSDLDTGDALTATGLRSGGALAGGEFTALDQSLALAGLYGTLTLNADGGYRYQVGNALAAVQALRPGETLVDLFTYRVSDSFGGTDTAQLRITVQGAWDAPVAADDRYGVAANLGQGGAPLPTRNVLVNDSDVDALDTLAVSGIRAGQEPAGGSLTAVTAAGATVIQGLYGELTIAANGSGSYRVDPLDPAVLALGPLQTLDEFFSYQLTDAGGLSDIGQIHIVIRGRNETPLPLADAGSATEAGGLNNATPGLDPSGNVLANDLDLEHDPLTVTALRTADGSAGTVGQVLRGQYGDLRLNADGGWSYAVDNSLPAVQALRLAGQTLVDVFGYTVSDFFGASADSELRITVAGTNDTPLASDDSAIAVEAGGTFNTTPGLDPSGQVLSNDSDVDGVANGETRQVVGVANEAGQSVAAGQLLMGRYGQLLLNADGSYSYQVDNGNPLVEALRLSGETLSERFVYRIADAAGAESQARLLITIQGGNDAPVARNDAGLASDQHPSPQLRGQVLPNDSDVDGGDALQVAGVRSGGEPEAGGPTALPGQPLAGRYGSLILNADGSYSYAIDLGNPEVLAAAGLGQVLKDVFTYTVGDRAGGRDQAELVITLDISAPHIQPSGDPGPQREGGDDPLRLGRYLPDLQPAVFVGPAVEAISSLVERHSRLDDGAKLLLAVPSELQSRSLGAGLGWVQGQFVGRGVAEGRAHAELNTELLLSRQGRIGLSADGLLADPSLYAIDAAELTQGPTQRPLAAVAGGRPAAATAPAASTSAQAFSAQLMAAARDLPPRPLPHKPA